MQKCKLTTIVLAGLLILGVSGTAFAGGTENPLIPFCDCWCLPLIDADDLAAIKITGPYMKGTYTISYAYDVSENEIFIIHLFIRWGNRVYLVPIRIQIGPEALCDLTEADIKFYIQSFAIICNFKFDLIQAGIIDQSETPILKEITITDKGGCEAGSPDPKDDIIRGEIIIGFVPAGSLAEYCDSLPECIQ